MWSEHLADAQHYSQGQPGLGIIVLAVLIWACWPKKGGKK